MKRSKPTIVTTGLITLDVVIRPHADGPVYLAGGTCGNVTSILSYLDWHSMPVARFAEGDVSLAIRTDLKRWGVKVKYLGLGPQAPAPVIVQRIRHGKNGEVRHSFSFRCPTCDGRLPGYRPVTRAAITGLLETLETPRVFFMDRVSSGALLLAQSLAERGTCVVFEPAAIGEASLFRKALEIAHIVKYSAETLPKFPVTVSDIPEALRPLLEVETRGAQGLRYRWTPTSRRWKSLPAVKAKVLRDAAGSGDWCMSGIIDGLLRDGVDGLLATQASRVEDALRVAQSLSTINCGYEGARGAMYANGAGKLKDRAYALSSGNGTLPKVAPQAESLMEGMPEQFCCSGF